MTTETRIESLETQVRTLRRFVFALCGLLLAGGLLAAVAIQEVPDVIRARQIEVVNDEGKVLVALQSRELEGVDCGIVSTFNSSGGSLVVLGTTRSLGKGHQDEPLISGTVTTLNGYGRLLVSLGLKQDAIPGLSPLAGDSGSVSTHAINGETTFESP